MTKTKNSSKKFLIISLIVALLAIGAGIAYYLNQRAHNSEQSPQSPTSEETLNLNPPTKEDLQRVNDNKQGNLAREEALENQPAPQPGTKKAVKPVITYSGQYGPAVEVGGYINGVFEDGGTCTATFTRGGASFSKSVQAVKNTNSVDCPVMMAQNSEFAQKGTWSVAVIYNSVSASGASDPKQLEVQ